MWIVSGEKNGKWIELTTEDELVIDTLVYGLEQGGYERISVREE